ncbi:MAG: stage 0 sporulation protein [Spirochaetes bacterium]|nr:stage 0 sporulation protein [Spirochaetota bacterium]
MSVIYIKLRNSCEACYVDTNGLSIETDTHYIIETEHGTDIGCTCRHMKYLDENAADKKGKILRTASEEEIKRLREIISVEEKAFHVCKKKILERKLDMKLVSVKCLFDRTKIIFYFVAENRIDFREVVRDLAAVFRTRIEMRQIGVRDETKIMGGYGLCGRELCCGFLSDGFDPVSIKMAKEQNLNLNSLKISGMCGRLLCCLGYEYELYKELNKYLPSIDTEIHAGEKVFKVIAVDTLNGVMKLKNDNTMVDVRSSDLQRTDDKYFISEEIIKKLSNIHLKENNAEAFDE